MQRLVYKYAAVAALAVVLGACGGSDDGAGDRAGTGYEQVFAAVEDLHGKERNARLLALAKEDGGELSLYTSAQPRVSEGLVEAFEEFSGLDVSLYRATTETVAARLAEEAEAGFRGADVVEVDGVALFNLGRESLLVDYRPDGLRGLLPGVKRDGWTVVERVRYVVAWNTDRVADGERPRSWEDLADPRWKGKLAMEVGDFDWYGTLRDYWLEQKGKSEADVDRLFAQMGRNARVLRGHTFMTELLAGGEFDIAASAFASTVEHLRKKRAPISWRPPVEPVIVRTNGVSLVHQARNPAAAVLYAEWITDEGQEVLAELGREPVRKDLLRRGDAAEIQVDYSQLVARQDEWSTAYERILQGGEAVPEG